MMFHMPGKIGIDEDLIEYTKCVLFSAEVPSRQDVYRALQQSADVK